jgi:hypothetical protein
MNAAFERLSQVRTAISSCNDQSGSADAAEKLRFCAADGGLFVHFHGSPFGESFEEFLAALSSPQVSSQIRTLVISDPDEGANGTKNLDLTPLLESAVRFPALKSLTIEPGLPGQHNQTVIARIYDEEGQIARLLSKAPALESLTVPSAPDQSFFEVGQRPLRFLRVDSGYDTQNFISNLSQSSCFPQLRVLDFADYNQRCREDFRASCTPFEDFQQLFSSPAFATVKRFVLRNSVLSPDQIALLSSQKTDCQMSVIP